MLRNNIFWPHYIREAFTPRIDALADCLKRRILPSFESVGEEAENLQEEEYKQMTSCASEDADPADLAEAAFNRGLDFYTTMMDMAQGIRNMFAAGLYHLFEQQLLLLHRRELLDFEEENDANLFSLNQAGKRLASHGICIEEFHSWPKIRELRALANTIKHADGPACGELKNLRPDLFCRPDARELGLPYLPGLKVFQPLTGESIYVTDDAFNEYVEAVKEFWFELIEALEK